MMRYEPPPLPGAPPYVIWLLGLLFLVLATLIVVSVVAIANWVYHDARERGQPGWLWLVAAIVGGWLTAIVWLLVRERYSDVLVDRMMARHEAERGETKPR